MSTLKIKLRGQELPKEVSQIEDQSLEFYNVRRTFSVESSTRSDVPEQVLELNDDEILELDFDDNTFWLGDADSIKQIFSKELKRSGEGEEIYLTGDIETDEQDRSLVQKVVIKAAKVFVKNKVIRPGIRTLATKAENAALKFAGKPFDQVGPAMILSVSKDFDLVETDFSKLDTTKKSLLLIHGTGSSSLGSFGEMKGTEEWNKLVDYYGGTNLFALQHRTLTCSPLQNVLAAFEALPSGITLDLITHSRGGLVADLLARFASHPDGFGADELDVLKENERETDLTTIAELAKVAKSKKITIDRVIRVACPANGTTLASQRMDMFLNVTINLLGGAIGGVTNPIFNSLKELVLATVETKDDVSVLPGLESMNPESPFIKVLNFQGTEKKIDSHLIVIAGSSELSLTFKSLLVLVGKFFFRGKNDLVVDTASMEFGALRKEGNVYLFLEETGKIDHITYFKTPKIRKIIQTGLLGNLEEFTGTKRTDDITFVRGGSVLEGGTYMGTEVTGKRPILVLLPGIMGSNLKDKDNLLWINYGRFLLGHLKGLKPSENDGIDPDSLIKTSYMDLGEYLKKNYDIVAFPFDWRLSMKGNAALLNQKIEELLEYQVPIKMVGHSMGGVLTRDFILYHPETYAKLKVVPGFKILFLGSPLGGSYRIPYVLFGKDGIIKLLAKIDIRNSSKELLTIFVNFPGILALLPINWSGKHDFSDRSFWEKLRKASGDDSWPIPSESDLKEFGEYQNLVLQQKGKIDYDQIYYIAGQSRKKKSTISDLEIRDGNLTFIATNQGDESVTWESGIPKEIIEQDHLYYANVTHGGLSNQKKIFGAIEDILNQGKTGRLQNSLPLARGNTKSFEAKEEEIFDLSKQNTIQTLLGLGQDGEAIDYETPIQVKVCHGDLVHAEYPVLAGHFNFDAILTTEKVIDKKLDGELTRLLNLGLYPGPIGTHQIVLSKDVTNVDREFKGAVIVGMGVPGELTPFQLMTTVSRGICRYLTIRNVREEIPDRNLNESLEELENEPTADKNASEREVLGISVIALANSYGGFSNESSIRSIILGIQDANRKIRETYKGKVQVIEEIEIIELFHDRALGILRTVKNLEQDESREFNISVPTLTLVKKVGRLSRIPFDNTSDWWSRIKVTEEKEKEGAQAFGKRILMAIATNGAKENELPLLANVKNIETLLEQMTHKNQFEPEIAKTMFELLIPYGFKEDLKRQNNITWVVDKRTASFPWEMLQEDLNGMPLSIHSGMVRQLATSDFRKNVTHVQERKALVVGDPELKGYMPQLKGAEKEAVMVSEMLKNQGFETQSLIKSTAPSIVLKLFTQNYKIIHLAGHGVFNAGTGAGSGMVIGDGNFLTTSDIAQMSKVPEFVFVNCCYLGQMSGEAEEEYQNRNKLAANIGTQLIEIGVKAVIVAGWAIDDAAAVDFCERFYACLLSGVTFGEATKSARKLVFERYKGRTNTWGAYQCYGDPFYKLDGLSSGSHHSSKFYLKEEVELELFNMAYLLESKSLKPEDALKKLVVLEDAIKQSDFSGEKITEYKADVYSKLGDYKTALIHYEKLTKLEKAGFSLRALEQYCNVTCKYWVEEFAANPKKKKEAQTEVDSAISRITSLLALGETSERYSLLGSAYKRKLMLQKDDKQAFIETVKNSSKAYFKAAEISKYKLAYPINNALQLGKIYELVSGLDLPSEGKTKLKFDKILDSLDLHIRSNPKEKKDFWDMVTDFNLLLSRLLIEKKTSKASLENLKKSYQDVWKKAGSTSDRKAEEEHLDTLISGLNFIESANGNQLKEQLEKLKIDLVVD
ncbi:CHAT domain-containing protein [Algoriphagus litoralis]|uniref:CHAT domain-containing protein n=1 Tax=Algoriphagus litoralis TaxID=2202829 RepID=UPI000DB960CA|nr:CHAT domain-containing protein [Algoriphagus litoralis]